MFEGVDYRLVMADFEQAKADVARLSAVDTATLDPLDYRGWVLDMQEALAREEFFALATSLL